MYRLRYIGFFLFCSLFTAAFSAATYIFAQNQDESVRQQTQIERHRSQISKIEKEIQMLDNQIIAVQQEHKNTLNSLVLVNRKIENRERILAELDRQLKLQTDSINVKNEEIARAESELAELERNYEYLVLNMYKHRDSKLWFMYILASDDISQGLRRWQYLKNYANAINEQGVKIKERKTFITKEKDNLLKLKAETLKSQEQREKEYNNLLRERQSSQNVANKLLKDQSRYRRELAQKKQEAERLNKEVEKLLAQAIEQRKKNESGNSEISRQLLASNVKLSEDFAGNKGKLPWPVANGVVVEQFGQHNHPLFKGVKLPFNNGINISAPAGSTVYSVFDGIVSRVLYIPGYNQCVLVEHGNYFTFYCKLASASVKVGDVVKTGESIGKLQVSENTSTLHFELWNKTVKQNPEEWLR